VSASSHEIIFNGELLDRGFWLYVWDVTTAGKTHIYYVGRTGDSSSKNAQSPFNRMGQHLGFNKRSNVLRRRMEILGIEPETCIFRLVAHGPILEECSSHESHRKNRDQIAAMERALAEAMTAVGYRVVNAVHCRKQLDPVAFATVRAAFKAYFPQLGLTATGH
jgi:hypothetical protein